MVPDIVKKQEDFGVKPFVKKWSKTPFQKRLTFPPPPLPFFVSQYKWPQEPAVHWL